MPGACGTLVISGSTVLAVSSLLNVSHINTADTLLIACFYSREANWYTDAKRLNNQIRMEKLRGNLGEGNIHNTL